MPIPVIIFIIFIICVILRYIFWPDLGEVKTENTVRNNFKRVEENDGTIVIVDSGTIFQFIESLQIIDNTINIETLQSRMEFSTTLFNRIKNAYQYDLEDYSVEYAKAYYMIKKTYPNRFIPFNIKDIEKVSLYDLNTFYCENIERCFNQYKDKMLVEMSKLKTPAAQKKRIEKIKDVYRQCDNMLNEIGNTESVNSLKKEYDIFLLLYNE